MSKEKEEVYESVREFYKQRISKASSGGSSCCAPGNEASGPIAPLIGYSDDELESIPGNAAGASFGCGNPLAFSEVREGQTVLDLGSGAGIDCFLAASKVGESGRVIGLDMTEEMVEQARKNAEEGGYKNVEFVLGRNEEMPVETAGVDWVISNCVINLSPEKEKVFAEAHRVLKPGGRLLISDMVAENIPDSLREDMASWAGCIAGAVSEAEYLQLIRDAGFSGVEVVDRSDFRKSEKADSLKVSSIRVSAIKGGGAGEEARRVKQVSEILDVETQLLISVGSAVAAGCIPCLETIVEKARAEGIDEKKLRAAVRTGQFVKDQPAGHMKAFADSLVGTHLHSAKSGVEQAPAASGCGCSKPSG
jgi:arsenite methyltransferase